jgi:hypothetical protein
MQTALRSSPVERRSLALALGLVAGLLTLVLFMPRAQASSVSISTDRSQYQVGDTAQVCYTVAGPGPVSITDMQADGSSHNLFATSDDGTGYCFAATITPPSGNECLSISATSNGTVGSSNTCFQVVQGPANGTPSGAADCGRVSVLGPSGASPTNSDAQANEDCFFQAYQSCTPATLEASFSGVDAGTRHTFSLQGSAGSCSISDMQQHFVVPRPPLPGTTVTCSSLSRGSDGGLLFSNCGGSDISVPPGA